MEFEQLLTDLSARFVAVPPERVDDEIRNALKEILEFFHVDRCGLLQILPQKAVWQVTHQAHSEYVTAAPKFELPTSIYPWAYDKLSRKREVFSFSRLEDVPAEAHVDKKTLIEWGVRSSLVIPVITSETVVHIIAIDSVTRECDWPEEFIPRLRLLGEIFVNAIGRKNADQALRKSEERLILAAASAQAHLWELDLGTGVIWSNETGREFYGLASGEELILTQLLERVHPEDRKRIRESIENAGVGDDLSIEYRVEVPSGNVHWMASRGRLSVDSFGKPDRITGVSIDISERMRMEGDLQKQLVEIERLKHQLEKENVVLREELRREKGFEKIIGHSDPLNYVLFRVGQVAPTDATVLILGETGTGKGMVASAIHNLSRRNGRLMITVNCAALPVNLIESELFGREKGAFTGAHARQTGRFEAADGGTIFLDEIGELPVELQSKLLRVLQDGEFERLGSAKTIKVNVRVIASTSRELKQEVRAGRFREDLFYRLNVFPVTIPPLRERAEDIPELVHYFVDKYSRKMGKQIDTIPKSAMKSLQDCAWPGNVRELEHVVERAVITTGGTILQLVDRLDPIRVAEEADPSIKDLAEIERRHILRVLHETGWKIEGVKGAALILDLHPSTLRLRMKKLGIRRP
jgi:formate hydrogenlyase transcriptional activator